MPKPDLTTYLKEQLADQRPFDERMRAVLPITIGAGERPDGVAEMTMLFRSYEETERFLTLIRELQVGREAAVIAEWAQLDDQG